jgi:2-(3-amino-3-carboxypropyl)histidine synthase
MQVLYVFVEIQFDTSHLVSVLKKHFQPESRIALMGTIQFTNALHRAHQELASTFPSMRIPQGKPLSPGENTGLYSVMTTAWARIVVRVLNRTVMFVHAFKPPGETLGCTAPILPECDALVFVADGRFHLEAAMIQNPTVPAYRYDPYSKVLSSEGYDTALLKANRW